MRLLLIMPRFFNYPQVITAELNQMGYEVDFFDDRPSANAWVKAAVRINKDLIKKYIENYFDKVMVTVSREQYDVVLLISGQSLSFSEDMIQRIREYQPKARFVLYQWDSQKNFPYIKTIQKYFDKCYSFDKCDVAEEENLRFLPLFFGREYEEIGQWPENEYAYDCSFVGTAHPQKYKFINMMSRQLKDIYQTQFMYFFFPSRLVYLYRKIRNKELRKAKYNEFHFVPLAEQEIVEVFRNSKCILDSPQAGQEGLTIRVFETLGAKRKLITINPDIKQYDFYRPENIYVYEGEFDFEDVFFKSAYCDIDPKIYQKYSLRSWLKEILCEE